MYWDLIKSQSRGYSPAYRDQERCSRTARKDLASGCEKLPKSNEATAEARSHKSEKHMGKAPSRRPRSQSNQKPAFSNYFKGFNVESLIPVVSMRTYVIFLASLLVAGCLIVGLGSGGATVPPEEASPEYTTTEAPLIAPDLKSADAEHLQFAQSGEPWSYLDYWGGTVSMNGCGLCAYTSVVDILTDSNYTPTDMLSIRGDWEGMDNYADDRTGVASGQTHHDYTLEQFGIESHRISVNIESLAATCSRGDSVAVVCAGGEDIFLGTVGDEHSYPGHFVCVWNYDGVFHVHDSAISHGYGCDVIYTDEEMADLLAGTTSIMSYRKCA